MSSNVRCNKLFSMIVIGIATILGLLAVVLSPYMLDDIFTPLIRLFEIMIAVLVIGALIKYLACGGNGCKCSCCSSDSCNGNTTK